MNIDELVKKNFKQAKEQDETEKLPNTFKRGEGVEMIVTEVDGSPVFDKQKLKKETLHKARPGLVQKKVTVQGKNGAYQKTIWVRPNDESKVGNKGKTKTDDKKDKPKQRPMSRKQKMKSLSDNLGKITGIEWDLDSNENLRSDPDKSGKSYEIEYSDGKFEVLYDNVSLGEPTKSLDDVLKIVKEKSGKDKPNPLADISDEAKKVISSAVSGLTNAIGKALAEVKPKEEEK